MKKVPFEKLKKGGAKDKGAAPVPGKAPLFVKGKGFVKGGVVKKAARGC